MLIAFGFGLGLSRFAPGTVASLFTLILVWCLSFFPAWIYLLVVCLLLVLGVYVSGKTNRILAIKDHGGIVIDEVVGMLVTFILIPLSLQTLVVGFILFRLLDIVKPFPVGYIDKKIDGGIGVMMDDVVAGLLANIGLWVLLIYSPL